MALVEERLGVEEIQLGGATRLEKVDDALDPCREVGELGKSRGARRWRRGPRFGAQQIGQCDAAKAEREPVEALAAAH